MEWTGLFLIGVSACTLAIGVLWRPLRARARLREFERAVELFRLQREMLEAKFFDIACAQGTPRGLRWLECNWLSAVTFGRDRATGILTAFVAVNIRFEAIEGGDMEGLAAVETIRDASALFHYRGGRWSRDGRWGTGGRALFNMDPLYALERLGDEYESIPAPLPPKPRKMAARRQQNP